MDAAFLRDRALSEEKSRCSTLGPPDGAEGEAEERATLERVEALADKFCEQVRGWWDDLVVRVNGIVRCAARSYPSFAGDVPDAHRS